MKFRAYDPKINVLSPNFTFERISGGRVLAAGRTFVLSECEISYPTGLKDYFTVDIWTGDLIDFPMYFIEDVLDLKSGAIKPDAVPVDFVTDFIIMHEGQAKPSQHEILPHVHITQKNITDHKLHVIGNKWQNTELL